jgi:hypothetical protein
MEMQQQGSTSSETELAESKRRKSEYNKQYQLKRKNEMQQSDIELKKRKNAASERQRYQLKRKQELEQQASDAQRRRLDCNGGEEKEDDEIEFDVVHTASKDHAQADADFKNYAYNFYLMIEVLDHVYVLVSKI